MSTIERYTADEERARLEPKYEKMADFALSEKNPDSPHMRDMLQSRERLLAHQDIKLFEDTIESEKKMKVAILKLGELTRKAGYIERSDAIAANLANLEAHEQDLDRQAIGRLGEKTMNSGERPSALYSPERLIGEHAAMLAVADKLQEAIEQPDGKSGFLFSGYEFRALGPVEGSHIENPVMLVIENEEEARFVEAAIKLASAISDGERGSVSEQPSESVKFPKDALAAAEARGDRVTMPIGLDCDLVIERHSSAGERPKMMITIESRLTAAERQAKKADTQYTREMQDYSKLPEGDPRRKVLGAKNPNSAMASAEQVTGEEFDPMSLL